MLVLKTPCARDEARVMDYRAEFLAEGDRAINGSCGLGGYDHYADWLARVLANRSEETVPAGLVPASTMLCLREADDLLVGIIDIRHRLNAYLAQFGGHIGYSIRQSQRRKGYGREMLRLALTQVCPAVGIDRALITCDRQNEASRRTILSCGGVFEGEAAQGDGVVQRYWVAIQPCSR